MSTTRRAPAPPLATPTLGLRSVYLRMCVYPGQPHKRRFISGNLSRQAPPADQYNNMCAPASWLYPRRLKALTYGISGPRSLVAHCLSLPHSTFAPLLSSLSATLSPTLEIPPLSPPLSRPSEKNHHHHHRPNYTRIVRSGVPSRHRRPADPHARAQHNMKYTQKTMWNVSCYTYIYTPDVIHSIRFGSL